VVIHKAFDSLSRDEMLTRLDDVVVWVHVHSREGKNFRESPAPSTTADLPLSTSATTSDTPTANKQQHRR
jgi:hypothetical protein